MKTLICLFVSCIFLLLLNYDAYAYNWVLRSSAGHWQWTSMASSYDGLKLIAGDETHVIITSNDGGVTWTTQTHYSASNHNFRKIASSADGMRLLAVDTWPPHPYVYTSRDGGATWRGDTSMSSPVWTGAASSSDGVRLAITNGYGKLYTSSDTGHTWILRDSTHGWRSVASSSSGARLVAITNSYYFGGSGDYLYTSSDSGRTWIFRAGAGRRNWSSVATSGDGLTIIASAADGAICISADGGISWDISAIGSTVFSDVACSSDGTRLAFSNYWTYIYTSLNGGITWAPETSAGTAHWGGLVISGDGNKLAAFDQIAHTIYTTDPQPSPYFYNGHALSLKVCENSLPVSIDTLAEVDDTTTGRSITWSIVEGARHGTAVASYSTTTTGHIIIPSGLTYRPNTGYYGYDTFEIRVTNGIHSDTSLVYVTVRSFPPVLTGGNNVCVGSAITLTDYNTGGVWSTRTGAATVSGGIVTGVTAGVDTIVHSFVNACGSAVATKVVTVNPMPSVISGYTYLCWGATPTLSDSIPGGRWSSSDPAIASIGSVSGLVNALSRGSTIITYSLGSGCYKTTNISVISSPAVTLLGCDNIGIGDTLFFPGTDYGFLFSSNYSVASTIGPGVVGVSVGTATISLADYSSGCFVASRAITVTSTTHILPIAGDIPICNGDSTMLTDPRSGGTWTSSNPSVATINSAGVVHGVSPGGVRITYSIGGASCILPFVVNSNPDPITGPRTLCVGDTIYLTSRVGSVRVASIWGNWYGLGPILIDGPPYDGYFTSSDTSKAKVMSCYFCDDAHVRGVASGNPKIIFTDSYTGCKSSITLTVNPLPLVSPITGPTHVCIGSSVMLSDSTSGGTWGITNAHASLSGRIVTGLSAGLDTITYTVTGSCGTTIRTHTVYVDIPPVAGVIIGSSAVCVGASVTLTDTVGGGVWSSGSRVTVSGGTVSGVSSGSDTVHYTLTNSCGSASASKTITVLDRPRVSRITGPHAGCVGSAFSLSDSTVGGSWSSSNLLVATVGSISGSVTGINRGSSIITYALSNDCGLSTALDTIVISSHPDVGIISGVNTVCIGDSILLTDTTSGGAWSCSNSRAIVHSGMVIGVSLGVDTIRYAVTNICGTSIATHTVNVIGLPNPGVISGPSAVCVGTSVTLTDTVGGGVWSSGSRVTVSGGTVSGVSSGSDTVHYTLTNSCGSASASKTITVLDRPRVSRITGPHAGCVGSAFSLSDSTVGGSWSSSNLLVATVGSISGSVTGINRGSSIITYALSNDCGLSTALDTIVISSYPDVGIISGVNTVCIGDSILLTDTTSGGAWSCSNSRAVVHSGNVTGVSFGVDTIRYAVTNLCGTSIASKTITVLSIPSASPISGPHAVCVGATIHLADSTTGGTWSSSDPLTTAVGSTSGTVTGIGVGSSFITYTISNICGSAFVLDTVICSTTPDVGVISGAGTLCVGDSILLIDSTSGGTWSCSNPRAIVHMGLVTGVTSGIDTVRYAVSNSCGTTTASHIVLVNPLPAVFTITGGGTYCSHSSGVAIGLAGSDTGISYQLCSATGTVGGPAAGSGAPVDFGLFITPGVYHVIATNNITSCVENMTGFDTISVVDSTVPIVSITATPGTSILIGESDTLVANVTGVTGPLLYQWYLNGFAIAGATTNTYINSSFYDHDTVTCRVTSDTVCGGSGDNFAVITLRTSSGIKIPNQQGYITLVPNPNNGQFTFSAEGLTKPLSLFITNALGEKVAQFETDNNQPLHLNINVPDGIYFLSAIGQDFFYNTKFVVVH